MRFVAGGRHVFRREGAVPRRDAAHRDALLLQRDPRREVRGELRGRRDDRVAGREVEPLRDDVEAPRRVRHDRDRAGSADALVRADEARRERADLVGLLRPVAPVEASALRQVACVREQRGGGAGGQRADGGVVELDRGLSARETRRRNRGGLGTLAGACGLAGRSGEELEIVPPQLLGAIHRGRRRWRPANRHPSRRSDRSRSRGSP